MKILIADDASAKIGVIKNTLKELPIYESLHIDQVLDLNGAKEKMVAEFYDLLILDLNMPLEIGEAPDMKAGAEFVDEIIDTNSIKKPIDIIVLSAFDSSVQEFKKQVERTGFLIIPYDENVLSWRETLKSRVSYLQLLREQRSYIPKPPHCDILLVTAVSVETNAVINLAPTWRSFQIDGDSTVYRKTVVEAKGKHFSVIHAQLPEMGMTAASTHTAKAVLHFKPQYVIMSGIAGGLEKDANIGDILVATDVWNYNSGKYVDTMGGKSSTPELCPDSKHIILDRATQDMLTSNDFASELIRIKNSFPGNAPSSMLKLFYGPMACGSAVVASKEVISIVREQSRKVVGLDMESYGVYYACRNVTYPGAKAIVIKSISDFADCKKDDKNQEYAAYTSAQFVMYLIKNVLL